VILSVSLCLSIDFICSANITESLSKPHRLASISTCVGSFAFWICAVIGATVMTGENLLAISFETTKTGLTPPCSEPAMLQEIGQRNIYPIFLDCEAGIVIVGLEIGYSLALLDWLFLSLSLLLSVHSQWIEKFFYFVDL
jgi:hypothetical protein